jgi:negative regulator of sigma E activity
MTQNQFYGSVTVGADEETALIARNNNDSNNQTNDAEEDLYVPRSSWKKYGLKTILVTLAMVAACAVLAVSLGVSPLNTQAGAAAGGPPAPAFDWKAWGADLKKFWADKKT